MNQIGDFKKVFWLLAVFGIWAMLSGNGVCSDDTHRMTVINDGMRPVEVKDAIMDIDPSGNKFMTNKETTVIIGRYKLRNELSDTSIKDKNGDDVGLNYLRPNQRVVVQGYRVSRAAVFATSVTVVGENRTIERLPPVRMP